MPRNEQRILVIGAGSAGARHARNLARAGARVAIMDPDTSRADDVHDATSVAFDLGNIEGYDGVVVASPSVHHLEQAFAALATPATVLVEKPLATTTEGLDALVAAGTGRLMVGYNLRLHEPVARLVAWLHEGRVGAPRAVRLWFGHYLPSWRPGVDYRTTYSARAELGGGVLLDATHELDLLVWMLGEDYEIIDAVVDRVGDLDIDVEDTVKARLRAPGGAVVDLELDYLSPEYRRGIDVVGDRGTLHLDWARKTLELETDDGNETVSADVPVDRSYEREADAFLAFVRGETGPVVDGATGAASVRLAERIRDAAR